MEVYKFNMKKFDVNLTLINTRNIKKTIEANTIQEATMIAIKTASVDDWTKKEEMKTYSK